MGVRSNFISTVQSVSWSVSEFASPCTIVTASQAAICAAVRGVYEGFAANCPPAVRGVYEGFAANCPPANAGWRPIGCGSWLAGSLSPQTQKYSPGGAGWGGARGPLGDL